MRTTSDPYMLTLHTSLTESDERQHHRSVIGSISRLMSVGDYMPANCYQRLLCVCYQRLLRREVPRRRQ